jgi:hypothetical protein
MSRRRIATAAILSAFVVGVFTFVRFDQSSSHHSPPPLSSSESTQQADSESARAVAVPSGFSHDAELIQPRLTSDSHDEFIDGCVSVR